MDIKKEKIDNTISILDEVLEKNKNKNGIKEAYEDLQKLKERRKKKK